jgi:Protein phosphatase 2C
MWRILAESVAGTSHVARTAPCQDAHATCVVEVAGGPALVVVVADGAGSAQFGEVGATVTCETLLAEASGALTAGVTVDHITRDVLVRWLLAAKSEIVREADLRSVRPRELACTAILAVVGEKVATFAQIGDGAVVIPDKDGYAPVFWPAPAEYANVTDFLTDGGIEDRIVCEMVTGRIDELAVFSDGLQRLALDYSTRRGHSKFFSPLFAALLNQPTTEQFAGHLRAFLDSAQINSRTDDDKTLVLAARLVPAPPATC